MMRAGLIAIGLWIFGFQYLLAQEGTVSPDAGDVSLPLAGYALVDLPAMRAYPLFSPTRLPPPPVVPVVDIAPPTPPPAPLVVKPPDIRLIGIMATKRDRIIMVVDNASGEIKRLRSGDVLDDWTIHVTGARTIEVVRGGKRHVQWMFKP